MLNRLRPVLPVGLAVAVVGIAAVPSDALAKRQYHRLLEVGKARAAGCFDTGRNLHLRVRYPRGKTGATLYYKAGVPGVWNASGTISAGYDFPVRTTGAFSVDGDTLRLRLKPNNRRGRTKTLPFTAVGAC